jgi:holliday junction DNA helicase RuvA
MIGSISGRVLGRIGEQLLVKTPSGIGYLLHTNPKSHYHIGDQIELYTLQVQREDKQELFSFEDIEDRNGVEKLLKVDGVGPKTAAMILYSLNWPTVLAAVKDEDYKTLATVKGLGAKTAKKIVLELKGASTDISNLSDNSPSSAELEQVLSAIVSMGYKKTDAQGALNRVASSALFNPNDTVNNIKKVLKELN